MSNMTHFPLANIRMLGCFQSSDLDDSGNSGDSRVFLEAGNYDIKIIRIRGLPAKVR